MAGGRREGRKRKGKGRARLGKYVYEGRRRENKNGKLVPYNKMGVTIVGGGV